MPAPIWNTPWLAQNAQRPYPFTDWATKRDATGTVELPNDFLVALQFPVHAGLDVEPQNFFLSQLTLVPGGYTLLFSYYDGSASPPLAAAVSIPSAGHQENRTYALPGVDDFADCVGQVTLGRLTAIDRLPPGDYRFGYNDTALEVDAIRPQIQGVAGLVCVNGTERSPLLFGDIELLAGENIRIAVNLFDDAPPQVIIHAIRGEGLNEDCVCEAHPEAPCVRRINGVPATVAGDMLFLTDDCLRATATANGLQLEDLCSRPCCGCEELQPLIRQIDRFADGVATMQAFNNRLQSEVTNMASVVLGSRIQDVGCVEPCPP